MMDDQPEVSVRGGWNSGPMSEPVHPYQSAYQHPGPDAVQVRGTNWLVQARGTVPPDPEYVPGGLVPERHPVVYGSAVVRVDLAPIIEQAVRDHAPARARVWYDYGLTYQRSGTTAYAYVIILWTDLPNGACASTSRVLNSAPVPATVTSAVQFMLEDLESDRARADQESARDGVPSYQPRHQRRRGARRLLGGRLRRRGSTRDGQPDE